MRAGCPELASAASTPRTRCIASPKSSSRRPESRTTRSPFARRRAASGHPEFEFEGRRTQVRVEGAELVLARDGDETGAELTSIAARRRSARAGAAPGRRTGRRLSAGHRPRRRRAARGLLRLRRRGARARQVAAWPPDDDPSDTNLWPEHFDIAFEAGPGGGREARHLRRLSGRRRPRRAVPVRRPVEPPTDGELWNATAFNGAELGYAELLAADDPITAAVEFMRARHERVDADSRAPRGGIWCGRADRGAHRRRRLPGAERGDPGDRPQGRSTSTGTRSSAFATAGKGPLENEYDELTIESTRGILPRGGTILGTSRTNPFKERGRARAGRGEHGALHLDGLIAIGGEDTLGAAARLHDEHGVPVLGVPKTIDNDLAATDVTFGFDTALQVATEAIDRLHTTAESPPPGHGGRGDGPPRGLDRAPLRARRRRRRDPDPGASRSTSTRSAG